MFNFFAIGLLLVGFVFYLWWISHTKDAPYVPMETDVVGRVIKIADVGPDDVFYDLGSGDGRLVIAAAMAGAKAYGIEMDRLRVLYSRFWIWLLRGVPTGTPIRLNKLAKIIKGDIFKTEISDATVVCTYLLPKTHQDLKSKLKKELKPGTKIIAVGFEFEGWEPIKIDPRGTIYGPIMLYEI